MRELGEALLKSDGLLVSERGTELTGMLGFILHNHFISGEIFAGEVFWWVEPEHRGDGVRLLREAERRAKAGGARHLQMIAPSAKVAEFYGRTGYDFVESTFQKAL